MKKWPLRDDATRARELRASGAWGNETIAHYARELARNDPQRVLLIDATRRLRAAHLFTESESLARSMLERGFEPGEVISYMLPNWYESCVISLAAALAGLVVNPLLPIYRERELRFMLADCESKAVFVPASFRDVKYPALICAVRADLPALRDVVVLRGPAENDIAYERYTRCSGTLPLPRVDADSVKMLIYTSGTTGRPKGVLHSHNTVLADVRSLAKFWGVTAQDSFFVPSPVTHIGGSLYAHEFPWYSGAPAVLLDTWSSSEAVRLIKAHSCTISAGATPFLSDLVALSREHGVPLPSLRLYICGGAAVTPDLIRSVRGAFPNCRASRVYGSTEVPTVTGGAGPDDNDDLAAETDGALCGTEVRIGDPTTGRELPPDTEGELLVRGPEMFLGYTEASDTAGAFTADGFFRTGDQGRFVDASHVVITGRIKDLIIRAGENISPREIEDLLRQHTAIADIAVVAVQSSRTGEAACACVVLRPNTSLTLPEIARFMMEQGAARQKIPEALLLCDNLPHTATGKVRKDVLRGEAERSAIWASRT